MKVKTSKLEIAIEPCTKFVPEIRIDEMILPMAMVKVVSGKFSDRSEPYDPGK